MEGKLEELAEDKMIGGKTRGTEGKLEERRQDIQKQSRNKTSGGKTGRIHGNNRNGGRSRP